MRIRIGNLTADTGNVALPGDPPRPDDLDELFDVAIFRVDPNPAPPFSEIAVEWAIRPSDQAVRIEDFEFRILGAGTTIHFPDIDQAGRETFQLLRATTLRLFGRRRSGGGWSTLGDPLSVGIDETGCRLKVIERLLVDLFVFDTVETETSESSRIRFRHVTRPVSSASPQQQFETVVLEPSSSWRSDGIGYTFPLEIVINNFFNANLDLDVTLRFSVSHEDGDTELSVDADYTFDIDFPNLEDVISLGHSATAAATARKMLPLILNCRKRDIEAAVIRGVLRIAALGAGPDPERLFDIQIDANSPERILMRFCPPVPAQVETPVVFA